MRKITTESFIRKAINVHGDLYDYSESLYEGSKNKIKIICNKHGVFYQTPNNHLRSGGCNKCGYENSVKKLKNNSDDFILKAKSIHGDEKYSYGEVRYESAHKKVKIKCKAHGLFMQTPQSHLKGRGCPGCYSESDKGAGLRLGFEAFVRMAKSLHGEIYSYSEFEYINNKSVAEITCPVHGAFCQKVYDHLSGCGCPICNAKGFNASYDGYLYVLSGRDKIKIGITNNLKSRLKKLKWQTPFSFVESFVFKGSGKTVIKLEKSIHKLFINSDLKGFDGATEWFHLEAGYLEKIQSHIHMNG